MVGHPRRSRVIICRVFRRALLSVAVVTTLTGVATAAPKRKVKIESEPAGATVYLNAKEDGPVCTTPCTFDAPVGDTPLIIELENHKQLFENLSVPAKKSIATLKFKLEPALGTINVTGPAGARITVDDEDKGKAPTKIEIGAGSHNVKLTLNGKQLASEFIEVPINGEVDVAGTEKQVTAGEDKPPPETGEVEGGGTTGDPSIGVEAPKPRAARGPILAAALRMDVGFRNFEYQGDQTANLTPESEEGQVLLGPEVELWPGTLFGSRALRGLSALLRFGYGVNAQVVTEKMTGSETGARTFWRAYELSVRQRFTIADTMTIEVGGGYVRDQHQFEGNSAAIKLVPDADYRAFRIGARISVLLGGVEPYLAVENRLVQSGGPLEARFRTASASGVHGAAGLAMSFGSIGARVEGAITRYSWTFTSQAGDEFIATGGVDSIKYISVSVGYYY